MNKLISRLILCGCCVTASVTATAAEKTAQQQKMTDCNHQASSQSLKGDARKGFMSTCLKKENNKAGLTTQQQKMKTCNADAKQKALKGDARKSFMSSCLKKS
ncbi:MULTISPECIES: PsiF family protein [Tatumella]|uniref:PsiF family protein n=1 Tax=Tatumella punctata TaxID=399969 RepID=A0ABW1VMZ5_9GAMM|nr:MULTISPECIES: PsiF family protein [unclassified Tatumella]MBS0875714.1 phosphate starvation-inducible protein [Tatumella sp. JGM82]MBS0890119.1 phosphate starvation-inducible protein [Tatumella sp. JGM94]MBS0893699.1 phosphate starvation-inducible protein [Tatumella sp. JGM130]MBS0900245.1 phosphate starvation-inducible protein [Tatumella sp. JGM100]